MEPAAHREEGGHHRRAFQGARGWRFGLPGQGHGGGELAFDGLPVFPGDPEAYTAAHGYNIPVLVAFSGTIQDGADEWTEAKLNGFPESQTAEKFDKEGYRILIAANKFQTGFDQPKLEAMYVDKVSSGVAAVQTLSRLNRCYPGKRTCVVDFTNEASTIQASFSDYYGAATIDSVTDPNVVYDLKTRLDSFDVYREREIDAVSDEWFVCPNPELVLRKMESMLAPAVRPVEGPRGRTEEAVQGAVEEIPADVCVRHHNDRAGRSRNWRGPTPDGGFREEAVHRRRSFSRST